MNEAPFTHILFLIVLIFSYLYFIETLNAHLDPHCDYKSEVLKNKNNKKLKIFSQRETKVFSK